MREGHRIFCLFFGDHVYNNRVQFHENVFLLFVQGEKMSDDPSIISELYTCFKGRCVCAGGAIRLQQSAVSPRSAAGCSVARTCVST
jgi:hypothetical protein